MSKKCAKIGENVTNSRSLNVKEGGAGGGWQWQWVSVRCHNCRHCWNPRYEIWIWWETFVPGAKTAEQAVNMFHNCHIQGNYLLAKNEKLQIWLMLQWSHAITQLSCRWDCTNYKWDTERHEDQRIRTSLTSFMEARNFEHWIWGKNSHAKLWM